MLNEQGFIRWYNALKAEAEKREVGFIICNDKEAYRDGYYDGISYKDELDAQIECAVADC